MKYSITLTTAFMSPDTRVECGKESTEFETVGYVRIQLGRLVFRLRATIYDDGAAHAAADAAYAEMRENRR